ncbi:hypothetical protein Sme01_34770 [Sphaerisporangium melleum]|uniref:Uncharacterized protein n=2 Tax=Sphaerisporangium melleum TaxID=321316 RepID=A0A917R926_9ACTN|nr:hypothetical protein GCM10007964_43420 [Sphaerisporangium melleum]GII71001.1 hypothetical protein Sme01_34770 [Sphaerisporangium melleum]
MRAPTAVPAVIPALANLLLGGLWTLSVFAGWGLAAFCGDGEALDACMDRLTVVATLSGLFAIAAATGTVGGLLPPVIRRYPEKSLILVAVATGSWLIALGVLYVGGLVGR